MTTSDVKNFSNCRAVRRRFANRKSGAVLVAALVCMAVVMGIVGGMLHGALRARRQLHVERDMRQVELLLNAGIDRAALKLAADQTYAGETWTVPATELLGNGAGEVVIEAMRARGETQWQVQVAAEFPVGSPTSVRRTRTFVVNN